MILPIDMDGLASRHFTGFEDMFGCYDEVIELMID